MDIGGQSIPTPAAGTGAAVGGSGGGGGVGREGSKRSVVAVAGVMVVQRRRWIGMELKMEAGMKAVAHERTTMSG